MRKKEKLTFFLVACGEDHVSRLPLSIEFLRKFCPRNYITVLSDRVLPGVSADRCHAVDFSPEISMVARSRLLKTSIDQYLDSNFELGCYLDTDLFPVSKRALSIRDHFQPPITFARDHNMTVERFGEWSLNSAHPSFPQLHVALKEKFDMVVDPQWHLWNGGLFLFNRDAIPFLNCWHQYSRAILEDPLWIERDQASLIAAVATHGMFDHPPLPPRYNWLVRHSGAHGLELQFEDNRFFTDEEQELCFLHFIEGQGSGYGAQISEWMNLKTLQPRSLKSLLLSLFRLRNPFGASSS
jgi:hypothetical protein